MSPGWNLPFVLLVAAAVWCRLWPTAGWIASVARIMQFFGIDGERRGGGGSPPHLAVADVLGAAGIAGLLFVAWSDRLAVPSGLLTGLDVVVTALGIGLAVGWLFSRAAPAKVSSAETAWSPPRALVTEDQGQVPGDGAP